MEGCIREQAVHERIATAIPKPSEFRVLSLILLSRLKTKRFYCKMFWRSDWPNVCSVDPLQLLAKGRNDYGAISSNAGYLPAVTLLV